jgi:hypothetical protein
VIDSYRTGKMPRALSRPDHVRVDGSLSAHEAAVASIVVRASRRASRRAA